jgi:hypothetical protein
MKDLNLTPQQLEVYRVINRINMAWVTLYVILALFAIGLLSFLCAIFYVPSQTAPKVLLGGINTLLGWSIKTIVSFLFSTKGSKKF